MTAQMQTAKSSVSAMAEAHRSGAFSPEATIADCYARIRAHADPAVFISLRDEEDALAEARALELVEQAAQPARSASPTATLGRKAGFSCIGKI